MDTDGLQNVIGQLHDAMLEHGDGLQENLARTLVKDEGRRLVLQIVRFIPPKNRQEGEKAIAREMSNLISEAESSLLDTVRNEHGTSLIDTHVARKGGGTVHLEWDHLVAGGQRYIKRLHGSYRNKRGKVPFWKSKPGDRGSVWKSRVVVRKGERQPYIEVVQKRVGRAKAAWCARGMLLGLKVDEWVGRHIPSPFAVGDVSGMMDGEFPKLQFGSRAPGVSLFQQQIAAAVEKRKQQVAKRVRLVVSDFNSALAANMKDRAKEIVRSRAEGGMLKNDFGDPGSGVRY